MNSQPPVDDHLPADLAAEYAVGLLSADERRAAELRMAREPAFADEVAAWQARLAPWLDDIAPVPAPQRVWDGILARIAVPAQAPVRRDLWSSLAFWRGMAGAGLAASVASLAFLLVTARGPQPQPLPPVTPAPTSASMAAAIRADDGSTVWTATLDAARGELLLVPAGTASTDARVPELWLIPSGGEPHSLGVIAGDRPLRVRIPAALRSAAAAGLVAVSLEPIGGSPTGQPTGPVIAKGGFVSI